MLDRLARSPELGQVRHAVQITSFGGSGTTAMIEHLQALGVAVPDTPGSFPFKHQRVPPGPSAVPPGFRVVYLFGDPRNAVVSVFRRGFQGGHYRGMRLRRPPAEVEEHLTDLEHFLAHGVDEFEIRDHFDRWHEREPRPYPVLFVRFDDLGAEWPAVRDFVGLSGDAPGLELRERASEWQALPAAQRATIDAMYGTLAVRLAALPGTEIR